MTLSYEVNSEVHIGIITANADISTQRQYAT